MTWRQRDNLQRTFVGFRAKSKNIIRFLVSKSAHFWYIFGFCCPILPLQGLVSRSLISTITPVNHIHLNQSILSTYSEDSHPNIAYIISKEAFPWFLRECNFKLSIVRWLKSARSEKKNYHVQIILLFLVLGKLERSKLLKMISKILFTCKPLIENMPNMQQTACTNFKSWKNNRIVRVGNIFKKLREWLPASDLVNSETLSEKTLLVTTEIKSDCVFPLVSF